MDRERNPKSVSLVCILTSLLGIAETGWDTHTVMLTVIERMSMIKKKKPFTPVFNLENNTDN